MLRITVSAIIIAASPTIVAAQDPAAACEAAVEAGTWLGGQGRAVPLSTDGPLALDLPIPAGEVGAAWFEVGAAASVTVGAASVEAGDPMLDLLADDGSVVGSDDDGGTGLDAQLTAPLGPGRYCVATRDFTRGPMTASLTAVVAEAAADESPEVADPSPPPASPPSVPDRTDADVADLDAHLCPPGRDAVDLGMIRAEGVEHTATVAEAPRRRFVLDAPSRVEVRAINEDADPYLFLYDEAGTLVQENDDADGLDSRIATAGVLPAGTYCMGLRALSDDGLPVTVTVSLLDAAVEVARLYAEADAAPPLDGSYPIEDLGLLEGRLRRDVAIGADAAWFSFEVGEVGAVMVDAVPEGDADPEVVIYDDLGQFLEWDGDSGWGNASRVGFRVSPGRYALAVREEDGAASRARVRLELFVPAD